MTDEHNLIKKTKGIFFNYIGVYNPEFVNSTINSFRKINYIGLGSLGQSIHHINYFFDDINNIDKITIKFRRMGVKPEDIDGFFLQKKKTKEELSNYESGLYSIWLKHYNKGTTIENKMIDSIIKELHILKNKWSDDNISYKDLSQLDRDLLKEDAEVLIKKITKYERI